MLRADWIKFATWIGNLQLGSCSILAILLLTAVNITDSIMMSMYNELIGLNNLLDFYSMLNMKILRKIYNHIDS